MVITIAIFIANKIRHLKENWVGKLIFAGIKTARFFKKSEGETIFLASNELDFFVI